MIVPPKVIAAAMRLHKNTDFHAVMEHLVSEQGNMVLNLDAGEMERVQKALIYYNALDTIAHLVESISKEADNG